METMTECLLVAQTMESGDEEEPDPRALRGWLRGGTERRHEEAEGKGGEESDKAARQWEPPAFRDVWGHSTRHALGKEIKLSR
jgi:hypothetical protein